MKKVVLSLMAMALTLTMNAQIYNNPDYSKVSAIKGIYEKKVIAEEGTNYTYYLTDNEVIMYFYDDYKYCDRIVVAPKDRKGTDWVKIYDSYNIRFSKEKNQAGFWWETYKNGGKVRITLENGDQTGTYFIWTFEKGFLVD